jgi:hypothetical protein
MILKGNNICFKLKDCEGSGNDTYEAIIPKWHGAIEKNHQNSKFPKKKYS